MKSNSSWRIRLVQILLGAVIVMALVWVRGTKAGNDPVHLTTDWSHKHVVFSAPRNLGEHVRLLSNPRYNQQLLRRNSQNRGNGDAWRWRRAPEQPAATPNLMDRDWSVYLGSGASVGANNYPAKFSYDPTSSSCATDFVAYNTGLAPNATGTDATTTAASGIFKGNGSSIANASTVTITNNNLASSNVLTLYANTGGSVITASGTATLTASPITAGRTVTVGSVVYTYAASATTLNTVTVGATDAIAAQNLKAAIDDANGECFASGCFGSGITAANPAVTHPPVISNTTDTWTINVTGAPTAGQTVTVGAVTYTWATSTSTGNQVIIGASAAVASQNLRAAIDDANGECFASGCFGSGITSANAAVTHPAGYVSPVVTVTSPTAGAAGAFTVSRSFGSPVTVTHTVTGSTILTVTSSSDGAAGDFTLSEVGSGITVAGGATGAGANDGLNFLVSATTTTSATNLAAAIVRSAASIGVTGAVTTGNTSGVTITSLNSGAGATNGAVDISTATTMSNATNGFTAFSTPLSGGGAGASIVAFNNIYFNCNGGTAHTTYWAYDTGGTVATSPVISYLGDQVAFVQNVGTTAELVLLRWSASGGSVDAPTDITDSQTHTHTVINANYVGCTAPCMTILQMTSGTTDTHSSPFYDFETDTIYVGDNAGHLHAFSNIFNGTATPAEAAHFPVTLTNGGNLTSPISDDANWEVYVASSSGYLSAVSSATGAQTTSSHLTAVGSGGFYDAPLFDGTNNHIYVITSDSLAGTPGRTGIYTFDTTLSISGIGGTLTVLGNTVGAAAPVYSGTFDNIWYNSANGTGNMYVCALATGSNTPTLYQIADAAGVLGTVSTGPALTTVAGPACSPVTEFFNVNNLGPLGIHPSGTDLIFLSVTASGQTAAPVACSTNAGCLMSVDVTSGTAITTSTATSATIPVTNGSSGIIVDNSTSALGNSQVYYAPLTPAGSTYAYCTSSGTAIGGCAIQASQVGLN